jgi:hypothetical protein
MQADIGKRPNGAVRLPHDEHGLLADVSADIVAGFGDIAGSPAQQV